MSCWGNDYLSKMYLESNVIGSIILKTRSLLCWFNYFRPIQHQAYGTQSLISELITATWEILWTVPDFQTKRVSTNKPQQVCVHNMIPKIVHVFNVIEMKLYSLINWISSKIYHLIHILRNEQLIGV